MEVILLDKVENLGTLGDLVSVKAGYARNYLIPGGKAKYATPTNLKEFEERRAEIEKAAAETLAAAEARKAKLEGVEVSIEANVGTEGKLFGSIGPGDIAAAVTAAGVALEKREVLLSDGPLRNTGEFEITVRLHTDVQTLVKVAVVPEED